MNPHETAMVTSPLGVGAVVTLLIAVSFWPDRRYRWFSWLGTAILVITGGAVLANLGVIPPSIDMGSGQVNPLESPRFQLWDERRRCSAPFLRAFRANHMFELFR